ncbi:MAG TPA: sulfite exporter TauE/SafE family protein [Planctomycetota bacterium]|nr:sulfite exporter TauE/SafE family protein [Planctomycetota bacterium]
MIDQALITLCTTAAIIGFTHTLIGPDHYLPFLMLGRANKWSLTKVTVVTILCGIGHVLSSIILGIIGGVFGVALNKLVDIESLRGDIAFYMLVGFGLAYFIWGVRYALRRKQHQHAHTHVQEGEIAPHSHGHSHLSSHSHPHQGNLTAVWTLFIIFVLGPCEPLIPILMFPAMTYNWFGVGVVSAVFGVVTVTTMTVIVILVYKGMDRLKIQWSFLEKWSHALAGFAIAIAGLIIKIFGV